MNERNEMLECFPNEAEQWQKEMAELFLNAVEQENEWCAEYWMNKNIKSLFYEKESVSGYPPGTLWLEDSDGALWWLATDKWLPEGTG